MNRKWLIPVLFWLLMAICIQVQAGHCPCNLPAPAPAVSYALPAAAPSCPCAASGAYGLSGYAGYGNFNQGLISHAAPGTPLGILPQSAGAVVGSPYYWSAGYAPAPVVGNPPATSSEWYPGLGGLTPYNNHFGPGFYRHSEHGHIRFPYYSYRAPWYFPGPAVYTRDTNLAW